MEGKYRSFLLPDNLRSGQQDMAPGIATAINKNPSSSLIDQYINAKTKGDAFSMIAAKNRMVEKGMKIPL
jgi:hypothetical protein